MCNNCENGCGWVGELQSLENHLKTCGYALLHCLNKCMNNKEVVQISRHNLDHHLKNKCPNRQYECPHCKVTGRYCDITTTHLDTCPKVKVPCLNTNCKALVLRCCLADHLTTCGYTLIQCPNKCMNNKEVVQLLRHNLDNHLKDKCPNRQHRCPHCKDTGRYCDITTTHLDTCPKLKIPCPNSECKISLLRYNLSKHRSICQYEKVPCKYAGIGCKKEPFRKDLEQHEGDDTFHFHLAIETVNQLRKEINEQREEIKAVKEEQKIVHDRITATCPCVFKLPEFSRHKSSSQGFYSPPFYTHPGGYKMCIKISANGCDDGSNTHVLVFAYLMRGRNDDNLPWPFKGEVTITLLNQLADKNHHTCTTQLFLGTEQPGSRVVDGEISTNEYGRPKFIPQDQLDHESAVYLKNDCLYFRIEVQATTPIKPWLTCTG